MTTEHHDLHISRIINAPPAIVWRAWTEPEYLERWWASKPVVAKVVATEVKPGGSFHTVTTLPDGQTMDDMAAFWRRFRRSAASSPTR